MIAAVDRPSAPSGRMTETVIATISAKPTTAVDASDHQIAARMALTCEASAVAPVPPCCSWLSRVPRRWVTYTMPTACAKATTAGWAASTIVAGAMAARGGVI